MILSIESSCDDSSIAITRIKDKKLIFHKKISQELQHKNYGGVVPELASRLHLEALPKILQYTKPYIKHLKAIAVTNEPGLLVTLIEGITMAKALSNSLNLPLINVNHLTGHIYSLFIEKEAITPISVLLISGGHTQLLELYDINNIKLIGQSLDDSFGESFDKVSKMLGLGYPGGPIIEQMAQKGNEHRFAFPIPLKNSPKIEFSYSGLKNAVRLEIEKQNLNTQTMYDICASFQYAATTHLLMKVKKYLINSTIKDFAIVGGASANLYVRDKFTKLTQKLNKNLLLAPLEFCADNAAMIGRVGVEKLKKNN